MPLNKTVSIGPKHTETSDPRQQLLACLARPLRQAAPQPSAARLQTRSIVSFQWSVLFVESQNRASNFPVGIPAYSFSCVPCSPLAPPSQPARFNRQQHSLDLSRSHGLSPDPSWQDQWRTSIVLFSYTQPTCHPFGSQWLRRNFIEAWQLVGPGKTYKGNNAGTHRAPERGAESLPATLIQGLPLLNKNYHSWWQIFTFCKPRLSVSVLFYQFTMSESQWIIKQKSEFSSSLLCYSY